eukprot:GHUV01001955.1.p1 GENE.GHUV01001955.1~~GHUV01001955.1.p1  ORF type:complete len:155 (-),score=11.57 GHUV01001955.1:446-910(-)
MPGSYLGQLGCLLLLCEVPGHVSSPCQLHCLRPSNSCYLTSCFVSLMGPIYVWLCVYTACTPTDKPTSCHAAHADPAALGEQVLVKGCNCQDKLPIQLRSPGTHCCSQELRSVRGNTLLNGLIQFCYCWADHTSSPARLFSSIIMATRLFHSLY